MKTHVRTIHPHVELYRDDKTGITWIENGTTGCSHTCHPSIDASGSVRGMKQRGFWGDKDRCIKSHGFVYNIDRFVSSDGLDELVALECCCQACIERRARYTHKHEPQ